MVRLTLDEVATLPPNSNVFEGVGKMYVEIEEEQEMNSADCACLGAEKVCLATHSATDGKTGGSDQGEGG